MSLLRKHYAYLEEILKRRSTYYCGIIQLLPWELSLLAEIGSVKLMSLTAPYETQLYSSACFCSFYLSKQTFEISDAQRVFRRAQMTTVSLILLITIIKIQNTFKILSIKLLNTQSTPSSPFLVDWVIRNQAFILCHWEPNSTPACQSALQVVGFLEMIASAILVFQKIKRLKIDEFYFPPSGVLLTVNKALTPEVLMNENQPQRWYIQSMKPTKFHLKISIVNSSTKICFVVLVSAGLW